jgi:Zn-dependent M28 family amino/carboxypeptidase
MRPINRLSAALLALTLSFCATAALAVDVVDVVNQVSQASYTDYLSNHLYTHSGSSRGISGAQHDLARTEIYDAFKSFGLNTSLDPFTYRSNTYNNVVGVLPGAVHPEQIYIVGAHYDSVNNPGADDNASGVAGVIEAARALSKYRFDSTVVFIAFDREEQGLVGSSAYASAHKTDNIRGMVSMDMIAYNPAGPQHDKAYVYYADSTAPAITAMFSDAISEYSDGISPTIARLSSASSDHYSFYAQGFESTLLIEYNVWSNPYYHSAADSVDTSGYIDYHYATDMTRGVVGYLATQAAVVPEPSTIVLLGVGLLCVIVRARQSSRTRRAALTAAA